MIKSLEETADEIISKNIKNIELISYFKRSNKEIPVFLSIINRNYAEIRPLLNTGLIKDMEPVKSYIFNIDKYENFLYSKYQEKIDLLKEEIRRKKKKKIELTEMTEKITPDFGSEDYDEKLKICLDFAKDAVLKLDNIEQEKELSNNDIGKLQIEMQNDPYYSLLIFIRSDKEIIFNERTEDNNDRGYKKILQYIQKSAQDKSINILNELKKKNIFKRFSPAKNYYITPLGIIVDNKLKILKWEENETYNKNEAEEIQDKEFNELKELIDFGE